MGSEVDLIKKYLLFSSSILISVYAAGKIYLLFIKFKYNNFCCKKIVPILQYRLIALYKIFCSFIIIDWWLIDLDDSSKSVYLRIYHISSLITFYIVYNVNSKIKVLTSVCLFKAYFRVFSTFYLHAVQFSSVRKQD